MKFGMNRKAQRSVFAFALLAVLLLQAPLSLACGPFSLNAVFSFSVHPEYPLEKFAAGEIGIVQPSYARSYLYVAYRYFKDDRFNQTEQQALVDLWHQRLNHSWESGAEQAVKMWLDARQKVSGVAPTPKIEVGAPANLTLVDLGLEWEVGENGYESRSANCCFGGRTLTGRVAFTVAAGAVAYRTRSLEVVA